MNIFTGIILAIAVSIDGLSAGNFITCPGIHQTILKTALSKSS
ncbi:hypothetical protein [Tepidanaerobacter acetatoxydans]|nr:hypothetical protein [Tepidanaerobacter acetatoxydans]